MTGSATCLAGRCDRRDDDMDQDGEDGIVLTEEQKRRQRARSIAIALALGALVLLFFFLTIVKFKAGGGGPPRGAGKTRGEHPDHPPPQPHTTARRNAHATSPSRPRAAFSSP